MSRLVATLRTAEGAGAIEADMHRYYSIDLLDLYRPGASLSWRQVLVRWRSLPPESASRRLAGESWTPLEDVVDGFARLWLMSKGAPDRGPHPANPAHAIEAKAKAAKAELDAAKRDAAKARAAEDTRIRAAEAAYEAQQAKG